MKRFLFIIILFTSVASVLPAQTVESVMRALQERHMAVEQERYAWRQYGRLNYNGDGGLNPDSPTYVPKPINWTSVVAGVSELYPSDGALSVISLTERHALVNFIISKTNTLAAAYVSPSYSPQLPDGQWARIDPMITEHIAQTDDVNFREKLQQVGLVLNSLKYINWPLTPQLNSFQLFSQASAEQPSGVLQLNPAGKSVVHGEFDWGPGAWQRLTGDQGSPYGGIPDRYFSGDWSTKLGSPRLSYTKYLSLYYDEDDGLHEEPNETPYLIGSGPSTAHVGFLSFTGSEMEFGVAGNILFAGRQMVNRGLPAGFQLNQGEWPMGYQEFKGYRKWYDVAANGERVEIGIGWWNPTSVPAIANFATGSITGSFTGTWEQDSEYWSQFTHLERSEAGVCGEPPTMHYNYDYYEDFYNITSRSWSFVPAGLELTPSDWVLSSYPSHSNSTKDCGGTTYHFESEKLKSKSRQRADLESVEYNGTSGVALFQPSFQHNVTLGEQSLPAGSASTTGDFFADFRRQLVYVDLGRGVDGKTRGSLGFSPQTDRNIAFDGFGAVIDLALLTGAGAFEVYYETDPDELPFNAADLFQETYTEAWYRYWNGDLIDFYEYGASPAYSPGIEWYNNPHIKQVVGMDVVVNVEAAHEGALVDPSRYTIKLYRASQKGGFVNGSYEVAGEPFEWIEIVDPGYVAGGLSSVTVSGLRKRVRIDYDCSIEDGWSEEEYESGDVSASHYFWQDDDGNILTQYRFNGFRHIITEASVGPTLRIEEAFDVDSLTYTRIENNVLVTELEFPSEVDFFAYTPIFFNEAGAIRGGHYGGLPVFPEYPLFSKSIKETPSSDDPRTVIYADAFRITSATGPGWFWQKWDDKGRVVQRIDQLNDNAFSSTWPDNNNLTTEITYADNVQTTVIKRAGAVMGRSWRVWSGLTKEEEYVATDLSTADYGNATNLKTTTFYYGGAENTGGAEPWAIKAMVYPDGTASIYSYYYNAATKQKTVTVSTGVPGSTSNPNSITEGTQTVTISNGQGYVISSITKAIPSNVVLGSEETPFAEIDAFGRPTRINYLDGTHITRTYYPDFRALVQTETDRNGVVSTYTYDILNRLRTVVRDGVTTTITPAGLTTTTTHVSSSGSRSESSTVNLFGEIVSSSSGFEPATTTSVDHSGGRFTYTTTETVSGRTIIKRYFEDGTLESVGGTGTLPYKYEYGVESFTGPGSYSGKSLSYTKEVLLADSGAASSTYTKTYSDGAGRIVVVETPSASGSGAAYVFSFYNAKGQLWKVADADGIVTLFNYDDQGRQVTVVLDVNKNDTIDAEDQVTSTVTTYASGNATTVTTVGVGTGEREVSRTVTVVASGTATITRNGNNALATTLTPNLQAKSVTVSGADGSVVYAYDDNGQPKTYTVKDASATTLQSASYSHDKFGRLQQSTRSAAGASYVTTFNPDGTLSTGTATGTGVTAQAFSVSYTHPNGNQRVEITNTTAGKSQIVEFTGSGELVERSGFGMFDVTLNHSRDANGSTTTLTTTDGGATTTFDRNAAGVVESKTFAGSTSGPITQYTSGGLPATVETPASAGATYGYGTGGVERGKIKTITYPTNSDTTNISINYDSSGRVETITDASGTRTFTYANDQLDKETYTAGPLSGMVIDRSFDTRERRDGLNIKHNTQTLYGVSYGYHGDTSSLENVTRDMFSARYTYKSDTQLIDDVVQKRGTVTVLSTDRSYDSYKRLEAITSTTGAGAATSYAYNYNAAGQRDRITRETGDYWSLGYQADGQLHTAIKKSTGGQTYPGYSYAYDFTGIGNRSTVAINDTPAVDREADYDPNDLNQVTSREVPGFVDVLGSVDPLTNVTVDVRNQTSPITKKGTWTMSTVGGGFSGTGYLHDGNANKGASWVDYSLVVAPGTYSVELMWSASTGNSPAVPVIVTAAGNRKSRVVNQQTNGGVWMALGSYALADGGRLSVRIANMGTTGQVVADAVRIKRATDTWVQVLDSEDADIVTTLTASKLGDIFHLAIPVDNSTGPVAAEFEITGTLAGAGENGTDAVAAFQTSAIIPPANTALEHDDDGRRKDDWKWTYTWNAVGQLRSVESTTAFVNVGGPQLKLVFDYDAQGRRFSKKVYRNGSTDPSETLYFIYDGWNLIAELNESLAVVRSYTWGPDISQGYQGAGGIGGLLSIHLASGATYFPIYDGAGNITGLVNAATRAVEAVYEYAPFGELIRVSGPAASVSPFGFSTKYTDKETGFCYYGHRYYDPELGHWISREPLGEMESANLYAFCKNDPINYVDYLGLEGISVLTLPGNHGRGRISLYWYNTLQRLMPEPGGPDDFDKSFAHEIGVQATDAYPWGRLGALELLEAVNRGYLNYWELPYSMESGTHSYIIQPAFAGPTTGDIRDFVIIGIISEGAGAYIQALAMTARTGAAGARVAPYYLPPRTTLSYVGHASETPLSRGAQLRQLYSHYTPAQRHVRIAELQMGNRVLREAGVPRQYISEALQSFEPGTITTRVAGPNDFGLRFYGGVSGPKSPYLAPTFQLGNVRQLSAVPSGNTLQFVKQWRIRPNTPLLEGRIRAAFGQPGGGSQIYVPNFYNNLIEP